MQKGRITITAVIEYELDPKNYLEEDRTPERMLAVDLNAAENDTFMFLEGDNVNWDFKAEVVEGETNG